MVFFSLSVSQIVKPIKINLTVNLSSKKGVTQQILGKTLWEKMRAIQNAVSQKTS